MVSCPSPSAGPIRTRDTSPQDVRDTRHDDAALLIETGREGIVSCILAIPLGGEQSRLSKERSGGCGNKQMTRSGELSNFRRGPLYGSGGHIREQQAESLGHRRVRE